jgi:hypothetical protein
MQKVHTVRNDKNKKRKEAHVESLRLQAKRMAKKEETLNEVGVECSVPSLAASLSCFRAPLYNSREGLLSPTSATCIWCLCKYHACTVRVPCV